MWLGLLVTLASAGTTHTGWWTLTGDTGITPTEPPQTGDTGQGDSGGSGAGSNGGGDADTDADSDTDSDADADVDADTDADTEDDTGGGYSGKACACDLPGGPASAVFTVVLGTAAIARRRRRRIGGD
jgi:hypothetical protein